MNSGEFLVEFLFLEFLEFIVREDEEGIDGVGVNYLLFWELLMKYVMIFFYKMCLVFFYDNRGL